ncbi:MAG: response regulator transcription factor, partial [Muribaculaceae bacterium]|nr:response regulator transcription factor [Muribaculaceae bacterium]
AKRMKENHATAHIPIIFLTAKDADEDMVAGLELGADDYISKPFSMKNVLARISAVLRRSAFASAHHQVKADTNSLSRLGIKIDFDAHVCSVDGNPVKMPRKELEILTLLLQNPGTIFSREEILNKLWPDEVIVLERVVDVNITRLRKKVAPYGTHIITRSGFGYGWQD